MITVHYFASIRESLGLDNETLQLPPGVDTVNDLIDHLAGSREEAWRRSLKNASVLVAVNQTMVKKSAALQDGDEVAFFPPVTGG